MTNLESNLYSIAFLATRMKISVYTLKSTIENKEELELIKFPDIFLQQINYPNCIRALIADFSIIQFCSFLDEYQKFNPQYIGSEYSERIITVRRKNKYGIKRINQWNDLFDYRNQVAAHNFDIRKESILSKKERIEYKIPDTLEEKIVFYQICQKMTQNIFSEFVEIRNNFDWDFRLIHKLKVTKNLNFDFDRELMLIDKNM